MTRRRARAVLAVLLRMTREERARTIARLPQKAIEAIEEEWWWRAHGGQIEPEGEWRTWLIMAGRGFGKTRAGAEWVWARAREQDDARIALVGASLDDVAKVMIDGESGLLAVARRGEKARWLPSRRTLLFPSGAMAFAYSGARPGKLRGPQHHFAWADELANWERGEETWPNLLLGLRLGDRARAVVTTTPQAGPAMRAVMALDGVTVTRGKTAENRHLPSDFRSAMEAAFGGTRLGRQELEGALLEEAEGSLWPRDLIERCRAPMDPAPDQRNLVRVVIGVDPPVSGGTCGIVACGETADGMLYVLADHSVAGASPAGWAAKVAAAAATWRAERIVAEANQGGDMVEATLRNADARLPVKLVRASRSKAQRAAPVATLFEAGKAKFAGLFPELEDELAELGTSERGSRDSPDRADAMVWALTELSTPRAAAPRVLRL